MKSNVFNVRVLCVRGCVSHVETAGDETFCEEAGSGKERRSVDSVRTCADAACGDLET